MSRDVNVPPSIAGLMAMLPPPGTVWKCEARERFLAALSAVLDLNYSDEHRVPMSQGGESGSKPDCAGFDSLGARHSSPETGASDPLWKDARPNMKVVAWPDLGEADRWDDSQDLTDRDRE